MMFSKLGFAGFAFALLLSVPSAFADNVQVLTMESDAIEGLTTVSVARSRAGEFMSLTAKTPTETITHTLAELHTPQVFKQMDGRDVVFFSVESDFNAYKGGHANMRFLHSALSGEYKNFRMDVEVNGKDIVLRSDPNPQDPDSDGNEYTSTFNYVFMAANTFFGKAIGIDTVRPEMRSAEELMIRFAGPTIQWF